jgi:hypothetical protein
MNCEVQSVIYFEAVPQYAPDEIKENHEKISKLGQSGSRPRN